jgi:hypothetical protein
VSGFPTIKFFPKGSTNKEAVEYSSGRSEDDFVKFLNEKCGAQRVVGGGITEEVRQYVIFKHGELSLCSRLGEYRSLMT